jgi:hypothetical protein
MGEAKVIISAEDRASSIIDHVSQKLGVFSKQGLAMGIGFALINKGIDFAMQGFQKLVDYINEGIEMNRQYEYSMVQLSNSINNMGSESFISLTDKVQSFSAIFATNMNDVANSLRVFTREGYNATESLNMLFNAEQLAISMGEDLASTQNAIITTLEIFDYEASTTGYITEKLNQITSTTGMSFTQINNILGHNADKIRNSGISIDTLVDILYTLENQGYSARKMVIKFGEVLDNLSGFAVNAADEVETVAEKFERITGTTKFTVEQWNKIKEIVQSGAAKGLDIGGYFAEANVETALEIVDALSKAGVTLEELNEQMAKRSGWESTTYEKISGVKVSTAPAILELVRAMMLFNEQIDENNRLLANSKYDIVAKQLDTLSQKYRDITNNVSTWNEQLTLDKEALQENNRNIQGFKEQIAGYIESNKNALESMDDAITTNEENIKNWSKELQNINVLTPLNDDIRYMTMVFTDATYASKIHNDATRDLVNSILIQQNAIKELNRINKIFSMEENAISLAEMRLQYASMNTRRGLTRQQEKQMKDLEKQSLAVRITMMENQQKIDVATSNLDPLEERLNKTKLWYDEEIYTISNTYDNEIQSLRDKITNEQILLEANKNKREAIIADQNNIEQILTAAGMNDVYNILQEGYTDEVQLLIDRINTENGLRALNLEKIKADNANIIQEEIDTWNTIKDIWSRNPKESKAYATLPANLPSPSTLVNTPQTLLNLLDKLNVPFQGAFQTGGYVRETGLALVHKGETVTSANNSGGIIRVHLEPITINANITGDTNLEQLGSKVGRLISAGIIKGITMPEITSINTGNIAYLTGRNKTYSLENEYIVG